MSIENRLAVIGYKKVGSSSTFRLYARKGDTIWKITIVDYIEDVKILNKEEKEIEFDRNGLNFISLIDLGETERIYI